MQPYQLYSLTDFPSEILTQILSPFVTSEKDTGSLLCVDKKINKFIIDCFIENNKSFINRFENRELSLFTFKSEIPARVKIVFNVLKNKATFLLENKATLPAEEFMLGQKMINYLATISNGEEIWVGQ